MTTFSARLPVCNICRRMQRFFCLPCKSFIGFSSVDFKSSSTQALQLNPTLEVSASQYYKKYLLDVHHLSLYKSLNNNCNFHMYQSGHHAKSLDKSENESLLGNSNKASATPYRGKSSKSKKNLYKKNKEVFNLSEWVTVEEVSSNGDCEFDFRQIDRDSSYALLRQLLAKEKKSDTIIVEGVRLAKEAVQAGLQPKSVYFCQADILNQFNSSYLQLRKTKLYRIPSSCMKLISDTVTPAGLLVEFKRPHEGEAICRPRFTLPIKLILDSLKDPGNAGTLIRTAVAAGCQHIIAIEGSVNVWERKVLRSAMGAHFNVPIYTNVRWSEISNILDKETQILLADSNRHTQQQTSHPVVQNRPLEECKKEKLTEVALETRMQHTNAEDFLEKDSDMPFLLPSFTYSDVVFKSIENNPGIQTLPNLALVVGSETAGLSPAARQIACDMQGAYVSIPMSETVTSLNSGIAGSIILYELRKRLMEML